MSKLYIMKINSAIKLYTVDTCKIDTKEGKMVVQRRCVIPQSMRDGVREYINNF